MCSIEDQIEPLVESFIIGRGNLVGRIGGRKESSSDAPEGGGLSCALAFDRRRRLNSPAESEFVAAAGGKIDESTVDSEEARSESVVLSPLVCTCVKTGALTCSFEGRGAFRRDWNWTWTRIVSWKASVRTSTMVLICLSSVRRSALLW